MPIRETSTLKQVWIFDYYEEQKSLIVKLWHSVSVETTILPETDQRSQKICPRSRIRFKDSQDKTSQK